jgi:hypothetical protein
MKPLITFVVLLTGLVLVACRLVEEPELGDALSGPFAVAGQPGTRNVYVLNSAFNGQYRNGSLLRFELNEAGTALEKREPMKVPRLGADLVASPDGSVLAAAFNSGQPRVKFFSTSAAGVVTDLGFEYPTTNGIASALQFFAPKQAKDGEHFLMFVEDPGAVTSRVVVVKFTQAGAERLFTLPDDLPYGVPEDYKFGFTAPAFVRDQGLFVAFPQGATGLEPKLPDPIDYLKNDFTAVKKNDTDLRIVSMAIVDFDSFLATKNLETSSAFRPLIYDADARAGNTLFPSDSDENASVGYRASYTAAIGLDQTNCLAGTAPTDANRKPDAVFVADRTTQDVLVFEGFGKVKTAMAALPAAAGSKHKNRLLAEGDLGYKLYSRKKDVPDLDVAQDMAISRIRVVKRGADCIPVWLRAERGRNSPGSEVSRLQANHERAHNDPIKVEVPARGSASFGVLSVGPDARAFVFAASYSFGNITSFEFKSVGKGNKNIINSSGTVITPVVGVPVDNFVELP